MHSTLLPMALLILLGVGAQWLSWKFRWPTVITFLGTGLLAGPGLDLVHPDQLFGDFIRPLIAFSVAIILFEGGLGLRLRDLEDAKVSGTVWRLVCFGSMFTWLAIASLAIYVLNTPPKAAILLGAILVVTGPTVILPMLRNLKLQGRVGPILGWEGMINDPLGAALAVLVFEAVRASSFNEAWTTALWGILRVVGVAVVVSLVVAKGLAVALRRYWVPDHLRAPLTFGLALTAYAFSDMLQPESGLLTVTLMGLILAHQKDLNLDAIVEFKENLSLVLIATLFVLLTARLDRSVLLGIQMQDLIFVALVVFLVRPMAVLISTLGTSLGWRERIMLGIIGPRGVVAVAVASMFSLELLSEGFQGADSLLSLTFLVIALSVTSSGLLAGPVARCLGFSSDEPGGLLVVGGHESARALAHVLEDAGIRVRLVDTNHGNVAQARNEGLKSRLGDVLRMELEQGELDGMIAMTGNEEVNTLAALRFEQEFGRVNTLALRRPDEALPGRTVADLRPRDLEARWRQGWKFRALDESSDPGSEGVPLFVLDADGAWRPADGEAFPLNPDQRAVVFVPPTA